MSSRPNVVFILSDDHGYADRSILGLDDAVRTPNLDRLARSGVSCSDAYVTAPICSPSRAGVISGQYQQRWGARWFDSSSFGYATTTLAERFVEQGYATGYVGKVHYGREDNGDRACPPNHGFADSFYGLAGKQMGRLNYLRHSKRAVAEYGPEASWRMAVLPMLEGNQEVEFEAPQHGSASLTEEFGRRARDFVGEHQDEPFFLMLAFNAVHNFTFQLPDDQLADRGLPKLADWDESAEAYADWYDRSIRPNLEHGREYYLAQLEIMDAQIGLLLDELERRGLAEDTIVVYSTDNGGSTCNFGVNAPLRGTKYTMDEGGIRVPFLVRWPNGGIDGGRTYRGLTSTLDLYPSLLSAIGAPAESYAASDGIDQLSGWRGETEQGHSVLHWDTGFQWAVREGDWKLSYLEEGPNARALRRVEHVTMEAGYRLTNLAEDIGESTDLSERHPETTRRLRDLHDRWNREMLTAAGHPHGPQ